MEVRIKTGANISRLLQSTVNIPQAYTELVKNCIQNGASTCKIYLNKKTTVILDNGGGFDHVVDARGMNDFDKYFVYGNSYTTNQDETTSLGQMGIGGKLSNDRLTDPASPWWSIETKNKHGKCFVMTYRPTDMYEFLDDYTPNIQEIDPRDSKIPTSTGSLITIHTLDPDISYNGWPHEDIRTELSNFFGLLVYDLKRQGKQFELSLNNEPINFGYALPGLAIPAFTTSFSFKDLNGQQQTAPVRFQMSLVDDWSELEDHPLKGLSIISYVKISDFWLSDKKLLKLTRDNILKEDAFKEMDHVITVDQINTYASNIIGFISCRELSTVLDRTGMPAKDLSHHTLRLDHPITIPFIEHIYHVLVKWIIEYHASITAQMTSAIDALSKEISSLVAEQFYNDDIDMDIFTSDEGVIEELADEEDPAPVEGMSDVKLRESVKSTVTAQQEKTMSEENKNLYDIPKNQWAQKPVRKTKKAMYIPYLLMDFGPEEKYVISKLDSFHKFRVLINTKNPKYVFHEEINIPELMSMYISEVLIKEVLYKKEGKYIKSDVDKKISEFYNNYLDKIRTKVIKSLT